MSMDLMSLARSNVQKLKPYQTAKSFSESSERAHLLPHVQLASNENPLGPSKKVCSAIQDELQRLNRYPDPSGALLKGKLAEYLNISRNEITLGNGSSEIIALVLQTFIEPNQEVIISEYAYALFYSCTLAAGGKPVLVPEKAWRHNLDAMITTVNENTKLIFIANPNNPTGTWVTHYELESFLQKIPSNILVIIDEAYIDYVNEREFPNSLLLIKKYKNLIITRTFSKIYGLAGLRVGYSISHTYITDVLNRVRLSFNVNHLAMAAAHAALDDKEHVKKILKINRNGLEYLTTEFNRLNIQYIPSITNFITFELKNNAKEIYEKLINNGVMIRPLTNYNLPNYLRVTIGLPEENHIFITTLSRLLQEEKICL
jgi:histidinol-phosphate aminotransferase